MLYVLVVLEKNVNTLLELNRTSGCYINIGSLRFLWHIVVGDIFVMLFIDLLSVMVGNGG